MHMEHIYRADFETLIKRYITGPLRMTNTFVNGAAAKLRWLYCQWRKKPSQVQASFPGAGGLHSCIDDLLKYADYQLAEKDRSGKTHSPDISMVTWRRTLSAPIVSNQQTRNWVYHIRIDGGTNDFGAFVTYPSKRAGGHYPAYERKKTTRAGADLYRLTTGILKTTEKSGHFPQLITLLYNPLRPLQIT